MSWVIFISTLIALPIEIALLLFFTMDRVTRHFFRVRLLVPHRPVLLEPFEVLYGTIQCNRMRNELLGGSTTESLNRIFLWSSDFGLICLALLTWGVYCAAVSLSLFVPFLLLLPLRWKYNWLRSMEAWIYLINQFWCVRLFVFI